MSAGWIYFARSGADGPIKVGRGTNPRERRTDLAVGSPVPIVLIGAMRSEDMVAEEAELHQRLHAHRIRGEWFMAEAVMQEMRCLASRVLAPKDIKVEAPQLHIRVSFEELALWKSVARDRGMTLTAWLSEIFNAHVLPEDEAVAAEELRLRGEGEDRQVRCRGPIPSITEKTATLLLQEEARARMEGGAIWIRIMQRLLYRLQMEQLVEKLAAPPAILPTVSGDQLPLPSVK